MAPEMLYCIVKIWYSSYFYVGNVTCKMSWRGGVSLYFLSCSYLYSWVLLGMITDACSYKTFQRTRLGAHYYQFHHQILLRVLKLVLIYIVGSHNICIKACWVVLKCTSPEILLFLVWNWNWICLDIVMQNNTSNFVHSINRKQILL